MTQVKRMENTFMPVIHFQNDSLVNLLFYFHIILYYEKVTSHQKYSHNLTLEVQIVLEN